MSKFHRALEHRRRDLSFQHHLSQFTVNPNALLMFSLSRNQSNDMTASAWRALNGAGSAYVADPREDRIDSDANDQRAKKKYSAAAGPGGCSP